MCKVNDASMITNCSLPPNNNNRNTDGQGQEVILRYFTENFKKARRHVVCFIDPKGLAYKVAISTFLHCPQDFEILSLPSTLILWHANQTKGV